MLKYLKTKQEIIDKVDFNELYKNEKEQLKWLKTLLLIKEKEPAFLVLTLEGTSNLVRELNRKNINESQELQQMKEQVTNIVKYYSKKSLKDYRFFEEYFKKTSLMYKKPKNTVLTCCEILEQTKKDYTNIKNLLSKDNEKLVGDTSFLSTFNYTMTLFYKIYEDRPDLLIKAKNIVAEGVHINKSHQFKNLAINTVDRIDKKLPQKENKTLVKRFCQRLKNIL